MAGGRELTWANVDFHDREQMNELHRQEVQRTRARIKEAVSRLRKQGVIDAQGRRIDPELPPDMRENSSTDFGG